MYAEFENLSNCDSGTCCRRFSSCCLDTYSWRTWFRYEAYTVKFTIADNQHKRNYFHKVGYKNSDIDIFLYGLEDEAAANKKFDEIYRAVCEAIPAPAICFRWAF
jgi:hypothetical protein